MSRSKHSRAPGWLSNQCCTTKRDSCTKGFGEAAYAVEIRIRLSQVCEPEEGLHAAIGAELDVEGCFAGASHGDVEGFHDLGCDGCAGNGADAIGRTEGSLATCSTESS